MRYYNQSIFINNNPAYKRYLKGRGKTDIRQYDTPKFTHPTADDLANFSEITHIWGVQDRFYKLANEYYNDPTMWWVIGLYNQKPTEFHLSPGDVIYIPTPLDSVLYYLGY
jgi:hypothetical protein